MGDFMISAWGSAVRNASRLVLGATRVPCVPVVETEAAIMLWCRTAGHEERAVSNVTAGSLRHAEKTLLRMAPGRDRRMPSISTDAAESFQFASLACLASI